MSLGLTEPCWINMMGEHVLLYVFVPMIWVWTDFSHFLFSLADTSEALDEKSKKTMAPEPEPATEVLFLCSHHCCGSFFIDAGALRKHADIHGERQHVCLYEGCGKVLFPERVSYGIEQVTIMSKEMEKSCQFLNLVKPKAKNKKKFFVYVVV